MKPSFRYMVVNDKNKVVEGDAVLCVECGFEQLTDTPDEAFLAHKCRLVTESVSTLD